MPFGTVVRTLLLIDDHPVMRDGLASLLNVEDDLSVIGEAGSIAEALDALAATQPDLAIVDLTLPDGSGLELVKDIRQIYPEVAILVISMHDESLYAERALRAGARGYLMKDSASRNVVAAVRRVLKGEIYLTSKSATHILQVLSNNHNHGSAESPLEVLTDRELEIYELIGQALQTKEIAAKLKISSKTVDAHKANIRKKLDLRDSNELFRDAVRWTERE
jgi:DNA-binding NarL/FixJ family response regulator